MSNQHFIDRKVVIATMHGKESVIAPVLEQELGVQCIIPENYNTDLLGTFTGEIERSHDPLTTARLKCLEAMELTGCDIGVASEGSFGPLPGAFFLSSGEEWLILIDRKNDFEVVVKEICLHTNYSRQLIHSWDELSRFAKHALFPEHGLILRKKRDGSDEIHKGIVDPDELFRIYTELAGQGGDCYAETDMRALYNPTRMKAIARAAIKLAERALSPCPVCNRPGFGVVAAEPGLPCAVCQSPTQLTLQHILLCSGCGHREVKRYPQGKTEADPGHCDRCNP